MWLKMKKHTILIIMICLFGALLCSACSSDSSSKGDDSNFDDSKEISWSLQDMLRKVDVADIDHIDFDVYTEGGRSGGWTWDAEEIKSIYEGVLNLKLIKETNMAVDDDDLFITFYEGEKKYPFHFEHDIAIVGDNRYEVDNLANVKSFITELIETGGDSNPAPIGTGDNTSDTMESGNAPESVNGAEPDVSIRPTEAMSVKLVSYSQPQGEFTMLVPEGWTVQNSGDYVSYRILAFDPEHPMRQIFILLSGVGFQDQTVANMAQSYMVGETAYYMPEATTAGWWEGFFETNGGSFAVHENLGKTDIGGDILFATATDSAGNNSEGLFTGVVYSLDYYNGMNFSMTMGEAMQCITADPYEFTEWEPVLLESLTSISFSDSFWQNRAANWNQIMKNSSYISNTWSNISDNVMDSYSKRTSSQDIMMQQWSDSELGYERIYDNETGETYKAKTGFMDNYSGSRYKKVEDGSELYNQAVSGYIEWK